MSHVDEPEILAFLDGELPAGEAEGVRRHLERCGECGRIRARVERRSRLFSRAVARIDAAPRTTEWAEVLERAGETPPSEPARRTPARATPFLKAAVILLAVTGVAAAIPGSPVDDWLGTAADRVTGWLSGGEETVEVRTPEPVGAERATPGVAVALYGGEVTVSLREVPPGTAVEVTLSSGREAEVEAAGARYRTSPGRIEVLGTSGEPIRIRLPEIASHATVRVGDRPAVRLEDGRLHRLLEGATGTETSVTFRVPQGPGG